MTDLEFYELRYSGKEAKYLRAFRALYLGIFFNVVIMASVMLAGVKIEQCTSRFKCISNCNCSFINHFSLFLFWRF